MRSAGGGSAPIPTSRMHRAPMAKSRPVPRRRRNRGVRRPVRTHVLHFAAFSLAASGVLAAFPHRRGAHQRGRGLFLPRSRPRLVQIRVTGDRPRAGPPPPNADAIEPKPNPSANVVVRDAATPEPTRAASTADRERSASASRRQRWLPTRLRFWLRRLWPGAGGGFGGVGRGRRDDSTAGTTRMFNVSSRITGGC
jgi:hypothetical protein